MAQVNVYYESICKTCLIGVDYGMTSSTDDPTLI